jgi:hypothetical protein
MIGANTNNKKTFSDYWSNIQGLLMPIFESQLPVINETIRKLIQLFEISRIDEHIPKKESKLGRPSYDRTAIGRAYLAKMLLNIGTTVALIERLQCDVSLRYLCGFDFNCPIPSESVMSRVFSEFAESTILIDIHNKLVNNFLGDLIVGHVARDSTAINAREKPVKNSKKSEKDVSNSESKPKKRGRPKKGEEKPKVPTQIEKQCSMTLDEMLSELPKSCSNGCKKNSKGYTECWIGYKLHIDSSDSGIPVSFILTSAGTHDSQVAIPLMKMSSGKINYLYDLMDAAYDSKEIVQQSIELGHVPIVDRNYRNDTDQKLEAEAEHKSLKLLNFKYPKDIRYNERTVSERVNSRLKDEFGARNIRVRGYKKVLCHLMFSLIALTISQISILMC